MPENGRKLVLHSPAGSEHAVYHWPLIRTVSSGEREREREGIQRRWRAGKGLWNVGGERGIFVNLFVGCPYPMKDQQ